jgi:hypothetical protein
MKIYILILIITPITLAQWEAGASYKIKSEVPENGFGISISRNTPYVGATFGIKLRSEVNLFRQTAEVNFAGVSEDRKFLSEDYNLHIIGEYYLNYFLPYFGLGAGYGELNSGNEKQNGFILSLVIGNKFAFGDIINPYIEVQGFNHLGDMDLNLSGIDISSFQFRGTVGINISINTLSNEF